MFYNMNFIIHIIIYSEKFLKYKSILKVINEINILIFWELFNTLVYFKQAGSLSCYVFAAVAYM